MVLEILAGESGVGGVWCSSFYLSKCNASAFHSHEYHSYHFLYLLDLTIVFVSLYEFVFNPFYTGILSLFKKFKDKIHV